MSATKAVSTVDLQAAIEDTKVECPFKGCFYKGHSLVKHCQEEHSRSPGQMKKDFLDAPLVSVALLRLLGSPKTQVIRKALGPNHNPGPTSYETQKAHDGIKACIDTISNAYPNPDTLDSSKTYIPEVDPLFLPQIENALGVTAGIALRKNVYLSGPTGCGKTATVKHLFAKAGKPLVRINMNGDLTSHHLIGGLRANKQGTYYHYGALPLAMKNGWPLLIDEIDYAPPRILGMLNPVLEGSKTLFLEDITEEIYAKPGFMVIATANTGGRGDDMAVYAGTEMLNTAFLDRFAIKLDFDYLPARQEIALVAEKLKDLEEPELINPEALVGFAANTREAFIQEKIERPFTTRKIMDFLDLCNQVPESVAIDITYFNWFEPEELALVKEFWTRRQPILKPSTDAPSPD